MRPLLALLSMAALGLATAAVRPVLSDTPKPVETVQADSVDVPGAVQTARLGPSRAPGGPGGVRVLDTVGRYDVRGANEADILASLVAGGPTIEGETYFGLTVTQLSFRYGRQPEATVCRLHNVALDLTVATTLPRWTPSPEASPALRRDWTRFEAALARHEARHRQIAVAWAGRVRGSLEGLTAPTCVDAEAEARRRVDILRIEADAEHRRYDAETGHGLTEGATWPVSR